MAYEDPNAPSPTTSCYAQQSTSPVDQSKTFLGGQHHPWRRLFARTVDICTAGFVLFRRYPFVSSGSVQSPRVDGIAVAASCRAYAAGVSPPSAFFGRSSL